MQQRLVLSTLIVLTFSVFTYQQSLVGDVPMTPVQVSNGAASFSIPIQTPPGTHSMSPSSLAIAFNSEQYANNLLGSNFFLAGLAVIHRCPATLAQDGTTNGVTLTAADKFCLNGARLMAVNGTYGADGTEYHTELESFTRIFSRGSQGGGPAWFEARFSSGQVHRYGGTMDSRIEAQGKEVVNIWAVNQMQDVVGNYMSFTYLEDTSNGEFYITDINYTGNEQAGLKPYNSVSFIYQNRTDLIEPVYTSGSVMQTTKLLKSIQTFSGTDLVLSYNLYFEPSLANGRMRVQAVELCDRFAACLKRISFSWDEVSGQSFTGNPTGLVLPIAGWNTGASLNISAIRFLDINGDGLSDIYIVQDGPDQVFLQSGDATWSELPIAGPSTPVAESAELAQIDLNRIKILDLNADGYMDIWRTNGWGDAAVASSYWLGMYNSLTGWSFGSELSGPSFVIHNWVNMAHLDLSRIQWADFNGDALLDVFYIPQSNGTAYSQIYLQSSPGIFASQPVLGPPTSIRYSLELASFDLNRYKVGDFNGDGLADIYVITGWGTCENDLIYINALSGNGMAPQITDVPFFNQAGPSTCIAGSLQLAELDMNRIKFFDANNDGKTDVYLVNLGNTSDLIMLNHDDGNYSTLVGPITAIHSTTDLAEIDVQRVRLFDANADGWTDVYYVTGSGEPPQPDLIYFGFGDGTFGKPQAIGAITPIGGSLSSAQLDLSRLTSGDFDGDGDVDLYYIQGFGSAEPGIVYTNPSRLQELSTIQDSIGAQTNITYDRLTSTDPKPAPPLYAKEYNALYPARDVQNALRVVVETSQENPSGPALTTTYQYQGYKIHLTGFGSLGFHVINATQQQTQTSNGIEYSQDWQNAIQSQVLSTHTIAGNGVILEETTNIYGSWSTAPGVSYSALNYTVTTKHDLNGAFLGTSMQSIVRDTLGNPIQIQTLQKDMYGSYYTNQLQQFLTCDTSSQWITGLLTLSNVTSIRSDRSPQSVVTLYSRACAIYSGLSQQQEIIEPASLSPTFTYAYDSFGNLLNTIISGPDIQPRQSTQQFDPEGRFLIGQTNALNQTTYFTSDPMFGGTLKTIDLNGLSTYNAYDTLGRLQSTRNPDNTTTFTIWAWCSLGSCPSGGVISISQVNVLGIPTTTFNDILGRPIGTTSFGWQGQTIFSATTYDALGNVYQQIAPYFLGIDPEPQPTTFKYDLLQRPIQTTYPDLTTTEITYNGLTTIATDQLGNTRSDYSNILGELVATQDATGNTTTYAYDSAGNLLMINNTHIDTPQQIIISYKYDGLGRVLAELDPDRGLSTNTYNVLAQIISTTNALNLTITTSYDLLGRVVSRKTPDDLLNTWVYDRQPYGIGLLSWTTQIQTATSQQTFKEETQYDQLSRPSMVITTIDATEVYNTTTSYDQYSRANQFTYPTGYQITRSFDKWGILSTINDETGVRWTNDGTDAQNRIVNELYGNGIQTQHTFNNRNQLTAIQSQIQNDCYFWNPVGSLVNRSSSRKDSTLWEYFSYDALSRLTESFTSMGATKKYAYDSLGNIMLKSDMGSYFYGQNGAGPHAVTLVTTATGGNITYRYDHAGNMISNSRGFSMTYWSFGKPAMIRRNALSSQFDYDTSYSRYRRVDNSNVTTIYIQGGVFEQMYDTASGKTLQKKHYIDQLGVYIINSSPGETPSMSYFHYDHLGSLSLITNEQGSLVESRSYDAFGQLRNPVDWSDDTEAVSNNITNNGFTNHEELIDLGLIHMNGRVYDPALGRFVSADPTLQYPDVGQDLNRYSYVLNNPLTMTDPSGFGFFKRVGHFFKRTFHKIGHGLSKSFKGIEHALVKSSLVRFVTRVTLDVIAFSICHFECVKIVDTAYSALVAKIQGGSWTQILEMAGLRFATNLIGGSQLSMAEKFWSGGTLNGVVSKTVFHSSFVGGFVAGATAVGNVGAVGPTNLGDLITSEIQIAEQAVLQKTLASIGKKIGISSKSIDQIDLALEILSQIGGIRSNADEGNAAQTRSIYGGDIIGGFGHHQRFGAFGYAFDAVDTLLTIQGLPSATGLAIINSNNNHGWVGGHSLGSLEASVLGQYGIIRNPILLAYPFINLGSPVGSRIGYRSTDPITGYSLFQMVHPNAQSIGGGGHNYVNNYKFAPWNFLN